MTPTQRAIVFIVGCIGTRSMFVHLARKASPEHLQMMGVVGFVIGASFIYLFLSDGRQTGMEAGGKIWWTELRPVHGCLYLLFAILAIKKRTEYAWVPLLMDVVIGLSVWGQHQRSIGAF